MAGLCFFIVITYDFDMVDTQYDCIFVPRNPMNATGLIMVGEELDISYLWVHHIMYKVSSYYSKFATI